MVLENQRRLIMTGKERLLSLLLTLSALYIATVNYNNFFEGMQEQGNGKSLMKSGNQSSCDDMMDALDHTFDLRRETRREKMAAHLNPQAPHLTLFDVFEPEAVCITDERFGSLKRYAAFNDGPKFVCGVDVLAAKANTSSGCLVYSIGSNNNVLFEAAVKKFIGCETHTFDPTLTSPFVGGQYATFHPWGLGEDGKNVSFRNLNWTSKSVERMVRELGHENRTIDILKVDCEGCEWESLPPFFESVASGKFRVDQVQVELHQLSPKPEQLMQFFSAADKARLRIFHKERNHWGCSGYKCLEYAFASESFLREVNRATTCPE